MYLYRSKNYLERFNPRSRLSTNNVSLLHTASVRTKGGDLRSVVKRRPDGRFLFISESPLLAVASTGGRNRLIELLSLCFVV